MRARCEFDQPYKQTKQKCKWQGRFQAVSKIKLVWLGMLIQVTLCKQK